MEIMKRRKKRKAIGLKEQLVESQQAYMNKTFIEFKKTFKPTILH